MPTIRTLLDRYGHPPSELALDWAWQIHNRLHDPDQVAGPKVDCLLEGTDWTDLEIADSGLLSCDQLSDQAARAALADLKVWAGNSVPDQSQYSLVPFSDTATAPLLDKCNGSGRNGIRRKPTGSRSVLRWACAGTAMAVIAMVSLFMLANSQSPTASQPGLNLTEHDESRLSMASSDESAEGARAPSELVQLETTSLADTHRTATSLEADAVGSTARSSSIDQLVVEPSLGATPTQSDSLDTGAPNHSPMTGVSDAVTSAVVENGTSDPPGRSSSPTGGQGESDQAMRDVKQAFQHAEAEKFVAPNRSRDHQDSIQDQHGDPWLLTRDTMRYRVNLSPKLQFSDRESQWTLALEPVAGLVVEPRRPISLLPRGLAVWRIYDPDAKPPRAVLTIRALHHGREGQLELVFCGGAEDMPGMSVPLATRWLEPLTVRVQSQAVELRGALAQLSTSVILRDQVPAVMQRKQAMMSQMLTFARLGVIMPEINRLAELVDGQLTMHAALTPKPGEPPIATWGQIP